MKSLGMSFGNLSIKCISLDLDGTLVFSNSFSKPCITEANISAIKDFCNSKGNSVVLATGRGVDRTVQVFYELRDRGIDVAKIPYLICLNGAVIVDTTNLEKIIWNHHFGEDVAAKIVGFLRKNKFNFFLINSKNEVTYPPNFISFFIYKLWLKNRYPRKNLRAEIDLKSLQKILLIPKYFQLKKWRKELLQEFGELCYVSECCSFCLEISDRNIDKFYGIQKVADMMGLDVDNFAAIGNEQNDVKSLENVGFGVGLNLHDQIIYDTNKIELNIIDSKGTGVSEAIYEMKKRGFW